MARVGVAILAGGLILLALAQILAQGRGLATLRLTVDGTPVTVRFLPDAPPAPAVVIAHGFAGSQQLMLPFATTLARSGYVAVSYDALGHGRNPAPLTGDVASADGATAALLAQIAEVAEVARRLPQSDGRLALLGHSMASDIVVRAAIADPGVDATIAVSLFSPVVTAERPSNLLVITGAWEPGLREEALRVAGLGAGPAAPFVTRGDPAQGTARRAVLAPRAEHVGVLYSGVALAEARDWLNLAFARDGAAAPDARGPWLGAWLVGVLGLAWAGAPLLPRLAPPRAHVPPRWRAFAVAVAVPAALTPLVAGQLPEGLLPAPVADYLAAHFLVFGLVTGVAMWRLRWDAPAAVSLPRLGVAAAALIGFALLALYAPVDRFVTAFVPHGGRVALMATLLVGTLTYFLADEALTRAPAAPPAAYLMSKLAFLASLAVAIALDPSRLFFLILILPVMLVFFLLFGLISRWSFDATGSPLPAAAANGALFAWAASATFPVLGQ